MRFVLCRYVSHTDSEPLLGVSSANSDRELSPHVLERMQAYSRRFRDPAADPAADPPTVDAARQILRWFNRQLVELAPGPVWELPGMQLTVKRDWALHV